MVTSRNSLVIFTKSWGSNVALSTVWELPKKLNNSWVFPSNIFCSTLLQSNTFGELHKSLLRHVLFADPVLVVYVMKVILYFLPCVQLSLLIVTTLCQSLILIFSRTTQLKLTTRQQNCGILKSLYTDYQVFKGFNMYIIHCTKENASKNKLLLVWMVLLMIEDCHSSELKSLIKDMPL